MDLCHSLQQKNHKENYTKLNSSNFVVSKTLSNNNSKNSTKSANALSLRKQYANGYFDKGIYNSRSALKFYRNQFIVDGIVKENGSYNCANRILARLLEMFKDGIAKNEFLYTSFGSIAKSLGLHEKVINKWMSILRAHDYIRYEVLRGQNIKTINGYEFNLKVSLNINKIPKFETKLIRKLKKLLGVDDASENLDEKKCEKKCEKNDIKTPKDITLSTVSILNESNESLLDSLYIQDFNINKEREIENKIYEVEYYTEEKIKTDKSDSCISNFPIETKESEKAKEFRNAFKERFGELIYRRYMGNHVQLIEFEHECSKKKRKYGTQLLLRFKNAEVRKDFLYLYGKLGKWLPALMKDHKVVFGGYYERFITKVEVVKRNDMHDICALDESTEAKSARHDFIRMYGQDTYASWIMLCDFKLVDGDLFLLCPNSWIQTYIYNNFEKWYKNYGLDDSNIIAIN